MDIFVLACASNSQTKLIKQYSVNGNATWALENKRNGRNDLEELRFFPNQVWLIHLNLYLNC